jgi:hypothetical protein
MMKRVRTLLSIFNLWNYAEDDVVWPFKVFFYLLPMKWCMRSLMYLEFSEVTYEVGRDKLKPVHPMLKVPV